MSASYIEISDVVEDEKRNAMVQRCIQKAREVEWEYWVDGCPVNKEVHDLALGVRAAMPEVKFYGWMFSHSIKHGSDFDGPVIHHLETAREMFVYLDECPFALGTIGYKDHQVGNKANPMYGIYSRKIANEKYKEWRDQYYTATSKDLNKAIHNARKYLLPYTTEELASITYNHLYHGLDKAASRIHGKVEGSIEKIDHKVLLEEILHLKKAGVEFTTAKFKEVAETIEELNRESIEESTRKVTGIFVRLRKVGEDTYADVLNTYDVRGNYRMAKQSSTTCKVEELPSDVYERISVLSILTNRQYVARVGYRVNPTTYWVESDGRV